MDADSSEKSVNLSASPKIAEASKIETNNPRATRRRDLTIMTTIPLDTNRQPLPPSCLGPDGKLIRLTDEERRRRLESARRRLEEVEQMTDEDPPGAFEEFMRGIDEGRPHRPLFEGCH
jgi:hypothetical protein